MWGKGYQGVKNAIQNIEEALPFLPSTKLVEKFRDRSRTIKRYDQTKPHQSNKISNVRKQPDLGYLLI